MQDININLYRAPDGTIYRLDEDSREYEKETAPDGFTLTPESISGQDRTVDEEDAIHLHHVPFQEEDAIHLHHVPFEDEDAIHLHHIPSEEVIDSPRV